MLKFSITLTYLQYLYVSSYAADIITTLNFVTACGYPINASDLITSDGYINTIFYMPATEANCPQQTLKQPILLLHAHTSSSDSFVVSGAKNALAYMLVDDCHPVYLGNIRSNIYGQRHIRLNANQSEFWNFTYHEIGLFDVAAMLKHIYAIHKQKMHVVAHSLGCAELMVLLAERSQYQQIIDRAVLMAPGVYMQHTRSLLLRTSALRHCRETVSVTRPWMGFQSNQLTRTIAKAICDNQTMLCDLFANLYGGWSNLVNTTALYAFSWNQPAGHSLHERKHLIQGLCNPPTDFRQLDYGASENIEKYGSELPPKYNINQIKTKFMIIYGLTDTVTVPEDVKRLISELPNVLETLALPEYNHLDVVIGKTVRKRVNEPIVRFLI